MEAHLMIIGRRFLSSVAVIFLCSVIFLCCVKNEPPSEGNNMHGATAQDTSEAVEQTSHGTKAPPEIVASFDGLGEGFEGPQGTSRYRNPSDNSRPSARITLSRS